jgi:hypothetical protein
MLSRQFYLLSVVSLFAVFSLPALAADHDGGSDGVLKVVYHARGSKALQRHANQHQQYGYPLPE